MEVTIESKKAIKEAIRIGYASKVVKAKALNVWFSKNKLTERDSTPKFSSFAMKALRELNNISNKALTVAEYEKEITQLAEKVQTGEI